MHSNSIENSGAEFIFSAIINNSSLQTLDLGNCIIIHSDSLAKTVKISLDHNTSLQTLKVSNNCFTDDGISVVLDAVNSSGTIVNLDITSNEISTRGIQKLGSFLCENNSLVTLTMSGLEFLVDTNASV